VVYVAYSIVLWVFRLLREIVKSSKFGKEYLRYHRSFGGKWDSKSTYGCYGNNLLFYPIPFYFSI